MAQLTLGVLNKDETRWNNLYTNLMNGILTINSGKGRNLTILNNKYILKSITTNNELDIKKAINLFVINNRYQKVIKTHFGMKKLNDFMKTVDYGSTSGSSLGTNQTRVNETLQLHFLSLRQRLGRPLTIKDTNSFIIDNNLKDVKSTRKIIKQDIKNFNTWKYTYIRTANEFFNIIDNNKTYTFHHAYNDSGISKVIRNKFKELIKIVKDNNNLSFTITPSRWNPSDLFVISNNMENIILNHIERASTLNELNRIMDFYFDNHDLIGLSLKKLPIGDKFKFIINKTDRPTFNYKKSSTSYYGLDSMSVYIKAKSQSMFDPNRKEYLTSRIFTGKKISNINLEIKGSTSMYGKITLNYINYVLSQVNINPIEDCNDIKLSNVELSNIICNLTKNIPNMDYTNSCVTIYDIENKRSKLISKYQSLKLVEILEKNKNKIKDTLLGTSVSDYIIKEIFYYGYSMGNDLFDNTKYFRIRTIRN